MSEEYKRFKQDFLKKHPSPSSSPNASHQKSLHQNYDPYQHFSNSSYNQQQHSKPDSSSQNFMSRKGSNQRLQIEQQSQFPFEDLQNPTFNDIPFEGFNIKEQMNFNSNREHNKRERSIEKADHINEEYEYYQVNRNSHDSKGAVDFKMPAVSSEHRSHIQEAKDYRVQVTEPQRPLTGHVSREAPMRDTQNWNGRQQEQRSYTYHHEQSHGSSHISSGSADYQPQNMSQAPKPFPRQLPIIYSQQTNAQTFQGSSPNNSRLIVQNPQPRQNNLIQSSGSNPVVHIENKTFSPHGSKVSNPRDVSPHQNGPHSHQPNETTYIQQLNTSNVGMLHNQTVPVPVPGHWNLGNSKPYPIPSNSPNQAASTQFTPYSSIQNVGPSTQQEPMITIPVRQYEQLRSQGNNLELRRLSEQNLTLKERLRQLESSRQSGNGLEELKQTYEVLFSRYQDSMMKECMLLMDRCRLEMKHNFRE